MESLLLFRRALSSPTMCRFIPALSVTRFLSLGSVMLDYARGASSYAAVTSLAEAEVGLAAGEPLVEAHEIREIGGPAR